MRTYPTFEVAKRDKDFQLKTPTIVKKNFTPSVFVAIFLRVIKYALTSPPN
jgi:hypothetical protein